MTTTYTPAEVFPPGEYLRDELEERGWTVTEFARDHRTAGSGPSPRSSTVRRKSQPRRPSR